MRVLLTGGSGFIGGELARLLIERGHSVKALVRKTSKLELLEKAGVERVVGDVRDLGSLGPALTSVEAVVHLAGITKTHRVADFYEVNGVGTRLLVEACAIRASPPRFVYVSSLSAAGPSTPDHARDEQEGCAPISHYGRSKLEGEVAVRSNAHQLDGIIVRPPIVFGERDRDFFEVYKMARTGVVLKAGFAVKRFSLVHVQDLCTGIALALERGKPLPPRGEGGVYNLADHGTYSWEELASLVGASLGRRVRVLPVPESLSMVAGLGAEVMGRIQGRPGILSVDKAREVRGQSWTCATERARTELAFEPALSLPARLDQTTRWYRDNGWLS